LIADALLRAATEAEQVTHFILPAPSRVAALVARKAGLPDGSVADQLRDDCGDSGTPHPLLMLVHTLETAAVGDIILVASFGQGGDALVFKVTEGIEDVRRTAGGVRKWLARATPCSYPRFQVINRLVDVERGIRGELDKRTAMTAAYRHRDLTLSFIGGRCDACGARQIPRTRVCANPDCAAIDSQVPVGFADTEGTVSSLTADRLVYSPDPPAWYGMVDFAGGGRLLMEFADVHGDVGIGDPMTMTFRIKDLDNRRGFARYFWKAAPAPQEV
jgi:hydroxymethylglutaryl-CoA synthase